ncbi:CDAN1-interacting nuclease 1 [Drosophila grimshawi]|uniref:CDAN1-interacting nuclease 1 n=1 Tax=Drosophila grimshawi TaxID=7222 RepID=B4J1V3_DROGR|nr:CDAN1-interacting nuclease 1 [Drosophila grimshawi]XP_043071731.1 CDAN1-interacting nuclease 1 [Drosophila grimshawi]EDV98033.1 GH17204 [Drosophila grimshawi]
MDKSDTTKKKILSNVEYARICQFINGFNGGLPMDCELEMVHRFFTDVDPLALSCILQFEIINKARGQHWRQEQRAKNLLKTYEDQCHLYSDNSLLIRMACVEAINPIALCRLLLQEKYDLKQRPQVSRLLKHPYLINDSLLAANVQQCLYSDNQEGSITDLRRRLVGEEYELKLKHLARKAGIHFYDEHDLRRMGYDKTPDIKMILPFLYKGFVVNWIESKANFGDPKSHKLNIQQQLYSYCNRFGPGIIIYWFGYHEETAQLPDNNIGITVLTDFPAREDLVFMQLTEPRAQETAQTLQ